MFSASSEARDRNAPTNANQIRLQTSRIGQEHRPIRYQLPARLSFRQGHPLLDHAEAAKLALLAIEVTVVVGVARDESVAADVVVGLDALDHVHRERQPRDPGSAVALVPQVELGRGGVGDAGIDSNNAVVVAHPQQAEVLGTLPPQPLKHPVYGTAAVPVGTVIMIAPDAVATGYDGDALIFMSPDAAAHMESETPQDISTPGSPNVVSEPVVSTFQTDSQLLKLVVRCAWGARSGAVQYIEN